MSAVRTERLLLRRWHEQDRGPFAAMNADRDVMAHFPPPLSREESDALVDRIEAHFEEHGFGLRALEVRFTGAFIGFTGLAVPSFEAAFTPAIEIGWRLQRWALGARLCHRGGTRCVGGCLRPDRTARAGVVHQHRE